MKKIELWKTIPGLDGSYEASTFGRIRRLDVIRPGVSRNGGKSVRKYAGKILKTSIGRGGYLHVGILGKMKTVHKWIALTWLENVEGKNCVNHKDSNKLNNNLENLEWCTHKENTQHMIRMGRIDLYRPMVGIRFRGSNNNNTKFTEEIVKSIKKEIDENKKQNLSLVPIAEKYKVSSSTIYSIARGESWKHVD